ncbi:MAG: solute carrier family 23 protein [Pseudomonadota bacterium]
MASDENRNLRYAVDEEPPTLLAAGLGLQVVILIVAGIVLTPTIVLRAAGDPGGYTPWAVFAGLLVCGLTTIVQAYRIGRIGAGYVLFMGTSGAFIAISINAVESGGVPLLATLVVASALIQFAFAHRLSALRKIITPTVGGTIIMLIAVTVFPICFSMINQTPSGLEEGSEIGPLMAVITFGVILGISLFVKGPARLWGPIIGVIAGSIVAHATGAFDLSAVAAVPWIGLPDATWPGLDLTFGADFWLLLVPFAIVTIVGAIETYGDGVAIQRLSKRKREPIDFRAVQGAVNADGMGNLLSGLAGTLPNTTYSTSLSVVDLTGVAARKVGLFGGLFLIVIGFCPKASVLLMSIPSPVAGAYIMILLILLFLHGLRLVAEGGLTFETGMVVCVSFWLAIGFQEQEIFADHLPDWTSGLLDNGMTAGAIVAIILTFLVSARYGRAKRIVVPARDGSIQEIMDFLDRVGADAGWDRDAMARLNLIGEEAMLFLLEGSSAANPKQARKIRLAVSVKQDAIELDFVSAAAGENLEALVATFDQTAPSTEEAGVRILSGLAERVHHEQFHGVDALVVTVTSRPL